METRGGCLKTEATPTPQELSPASQASENPAGFFQRGCMGGVGARAGSPPSARTALCTWEVRSRVVPEPSVEGLVMLKRVVSPGTLF